MSRIIKASQVRQEENLRRLFTEDKDSKLDIQTDGFDPETDMANAIEEINQARQEAAAVLEEARVEADQLKLQLQQELEQIRESAFQEAYNHGVEEGFQAGLNHFVSEMEKFIHNLDREVERVQMLMDHQVQGMGMKLIVLSTQIAEKIIQRQVELEPELIIKQIETILAEISRVKSLAIRIHPSELDLVKAHEERFLKLTQEIEKIQFVIDYSLEPGGCIVETDSGGVDATIETQLNRIQELLLEGNWDEDA